MSSLLSALSGVHNSSEPLPGLLTSGQPDPAALAAFKAAGGKVVLDIRDSMEPRPFDEPATVRGLGLDYQNVSVRQGALDDSAMDRVLEAIRGAAARQEPMLFHCASANRTGGPMIAYLMLDHGMEEEDAVDAAMRLGLRGADLVEWALDYVHRKQNG